MERRTLLAAALSFAVIMVWTAWLGPKPAPESADESADIVDVADAPAATNERETRPAVPPPSFGQSDTTPSGGLVFDSEIPEEEVKVETPLYTAVFSTRGGALVSLHSHEHDDTEGRPLPLVQEHIAGITAQPELLVDADGNGPFAPMSLRDTNFTVRREPGNGLKIGELTFTARSEDGTTIVRRYGFAPDTHAMAHTNSVSGLKGGFEGAMTLVWGAGMPLTETPQKSDKQNFAAIARVGSNVEQKSPKDFNSRDDDYEVDGDVRWAISKNRYFFAGLFAQDQSVKSVRIFGNNAEDLTNYAFQIPINDGAVTAEHTLYIGPTDEKELATLGEGIENQIGISDMYGMPGFMEALFSPVARLLHRVLNWIYAIVPNYGVAILLLAFVTKLLFFPLTRKSAQSMKAMADLKPEMEALREKHKDNPQKLNIETMGLYKKHGVNPMAGCLPLLIQMPVFIALFAVLRSAIELRHAPFALWINDLSAPDTLFSLSNGLPLLPDQLHILPLLMAATTLLMQNQTITDPRQKSLMLMMPVVMLFFFYNMPSGLTLYWTSQNIFSFVEQKIARRSPVTAAAKAA